MVCAQRDKGLAFQTLYEVSRNYPLIFKMRGTIQRRLLGEGPSRLQAGDPVSRLRGAPGQEQRPSFWEDHQGNQRRAGGSCAPRARPLFSPPQTIPESLWRGQRGWLRFFC